MWRLIKKKSAYVIYEWPLRFGQLGAMKRNLLNLSSKECRKEVKVILLLAIIIENDFEGEDLFRVSMSCIQKLCMSKVNYMIRYVHRTYIQVILNENHAQF